MSKYTCRSMALMSVLGTATLAPASLFFDDFDSGASAQWGNQRGSWFAAGGVYDSQFPSNSPVTYSDVPYLLTDFSVDVDINALQDGGIFLRSDFNGGSESGVLLVTGGFLGTGTGLYWHVVQNGSYSGILNSVGGLFVPGVSNAHIRVEVVGNTYSAYVNGSNVAATTLVDNTFASGRAGLYDFSNQTFDNFDLNVVPEPAGLALLGVGVVSVWRRTPRRR